MATKHPREAKVDHEGGNPDQNDHCRRRDDEYLASLVVADATLAHC
jgi:hypothetical protein